MKKLLLLSAGILVLSFCISNPAHAQGHYRGNSSSITTPVRPGSVTLNLGIGSGAEYSGDYYNGAFGMKAALEFGIWKAGPGTITLGPEVGTSFSHGGYYDDYRSGTTVVAIRSAWHYGWKVRGLDTYGGLSAGLGFHHYQYNNDGRVHTNEVLAVPGIFVGASYFVTPVFGFNAEAGYDITNAQVGIIFRLH